MNGVNKQQSSANALFEHTKVALQYNYNYIQAMLLTEENRISQDGGNLLLSGTVCQVMMTELLN